jgi:hypothetical protein
MAGGLGGGLDEMMLAVGGGALENLRHAAKYYPDLVTEEGLRKDRERSRTFVLQGPYKQMSDSSGQT